jgi:hypothetical protein
MKVYGGLIEIFDGRSEKGIDQRPGFPSRDTVVVLLD